MVQADESSLEIEIWDARVSVRETEFKFLLSDSDYQSVCKALNPPLKEREFLNRYFTVDPPPQRKDWVLRLRVEGDSQELTLKIGREISPGVFDATELNEMVPNQSPSGWESTEPVRKFRDEISRQPLLLQGEAKNRRLVFAAPIKVGQEWELDRCELPGGSVFCELEVELEYSNPEDLSKKNQLVLEWLRGHGAEPLPSEKTKYARFLAAVG